MGHTCFTSNDAKKGRHSQPAKPLPKLTSVSNQATHSSLVVMLGEEGVHLTNGTTAEKTDSSSLKAMLVII